MQSHFIYNLLTLLSWIWDSLAKLWKCSSPSAPTTAAYGSSAIASGGGKSIGDELKIQEHGLLAYRRAG